MSSGASRGEAAARSLLTFEPAVVTWPEGTSRSPVEHEVRFVEPVLDAVLLRDRVLDHGVIATFGADLRHLAERTAEELLGARVSDGLAPGRVELLVCRVCSDLGCGSLTVALDVGEQEVVWSQPRWEDGCEEATVDERLGDATFRFGRAGYEAAVRGAALAVADLPVRPRPVRRPWWRRG